MGLSVHEQPNPKKLVMAKVAILFIVAFVPSLQAGLLEHLTTEVENLKTIQATQSAEMARMNKKGAQCGYRYRWDDKDSTITYEAQMVNTGSGLLDTATGVWTAEDSGLYQVSWSLQHSINSGEINSISLSKYLHSVNDVLQNHLMTMRIYDHIKCVKYYAAE